MDHQVYKAYVLYIERVNRKNLIKNHNKEAKIVQWKHFLPFQDSTQI